MKKVALIVTTTLKTRVVVDVPDDFDVRTDENLLFNSSNVDDNLLDVIEEKARTNYIDNMSYGIFENIDEIVNDFEVPYGEGYNENN